MICPECSASTKIIDSRWCSGEAARAGVGVQYTRRRHVCAEGHKFTTFETVRNESFQEAVDLIQDRLEALEKIARDRVELSAVVRLIEEWDDKRKTMELGKSRRLALFAMAKEAGLVGQ